MYDALLTCFMLLYACIFILVCLAVAIFVVVFTIVDVTLLTSIPVDELSQTLVIYKR